MCGVACLGVVDDLNKDRFECLTDLMYRGAVVCLVFVSRGESFLRICCFGGGDGDLASSIEYSTHYFGRGIFL